MNISADVGMCAACLCICQHLSRRLRRQLDTVERQDEDAESEDLFMDNLMGFNVLVTFANQWKMDDGGTGCTLNYYMLDAANHFMHDVVATTDGAVGQQSAKVSMPYDTRDKLVVVPGVYKGSFEMTTGSDRKPVLKMVDIKFNDAVQVSDCFVDSNLVNKASAGGDQKPGAKGTK